MEGNKVRKDAQLSCGYHPLANEHNQTGVNQSCLTIQQQKTDSVAHSLQPHLCTSFNA